MSIAFDFNLEPKAALAYLEGKGYHLTFNYDEMIGSAHHKAFTVAKVTRLDLLNDIFTSLHEAFQSGQTFNDWKNAIKPTLQQKGWWGKKEIADPKTGELKEVYIGSRRIRTIFNTNMRVAYGVQRYQTMRGLTNAIYWRYTSMLLANTRDGHAALHGTILHRDDPFWQVNYPPNDWNCKCKVRAYSLKQLQAKGLKVAGTTPQNIASKDWAYDVGAGSRVAALSKMELGTGLAQLQPNPQLDKLTDAQLKARFYKTLGIAEGGHYVDVVNDPMSVGDDLFTNFKTGADKLRKQQRHLYLDELANTIADPDEIYLEVENRTGQSKLVKKMLRYFEAENGDKKAFMALFTYEQDKTIGTSIYVVNPGMIEKKRVQKLIYQKGQ